MSNYPLNDVFELFDKGKLTEQNDEQLLYFYKICANCQPGDSFSHTKADLVAKLIIAELFRLQNDRLVKQVSKLETVAAEQKQLAVDAGKQTQNLIRLTVALILVSVGLLAFGIAQTAIMLKQNADAHAQQIQAGQHQKGATP